MSDLTISLRQSAERRAITARFCDSLCEASARRRERDYDVTGPDGQPEMAWMAYERSLMLCLVNVERASRGLTEVSAAEVARWEQQAAGHSDYAGQWAFSCAQLAMGHEPRRA